MASLYYFSRCDIHVHVQTAMAARPPLRRRSKVRRDAAGAAQPLPSPLPLLFFIFRARGVFSYTFCLSAASERVVASVIKAAARCRRRFRFSAARASADHMSPLPGVHRHHHRRRMLAMLMSS
jgi:hypothetical protein